MGQSKSILTVPGPTWCSFTDRLRTEFLIKQQLKIPAHLKRVTTLPCEIFMPENQLTLKQVDNDKSQSSVD